MRYKCLCMRGGRQERRRRRQSRVEKRDEKGLKHRHMGPGGAGLTKGRSKGRSEVGGEGACLKRVCCAAGAPCSLPPRGLRGRQGCLTEECLHMP